MDQRREMAKFAIETVNHRVKLIIGTSHMVADEIVNFSNFCLDAGADAVMILPPYYFHFGTEALLQYYDRLAAQIHGNIYIYNFPDNTGYTIPPQTVLALAKIHSNIVGMKDTISGMDHTRELIKVVKSQIPSFEIYSGFDDNFAHNVLAGGNGCIGALSNVVPEVCSAWVRAFRENDLDGIARGQQTIDRLMDLYAVRSPFLPVIKEACKLRGVAASSTGTFPTPRSWSCCAGRVLSKFPLQKAKKRPAVFRQRAAFEYGKPRESGRERGPQRMVMVPPVSAARSPAV